MLTTHRKWILGSAIVTIVAFTGFTSTSVAPQANPADWALSSTQVAQARQALMLVATQSDPSAQSVRVTGAWPSNITDGGAFGTDRITANTAMGQPRAVFGAETQREVICSEGHGRFSTASLPHPPGAPAKTYSHVVICFDPTTGEITDSGYDDAPLTGAFTSRTSLDTSSPITQTTK